MLCSKNEFLSAIEPWRGKLCAVTLHTEQVKGTFLITFESASAGGVLEFSAHSLFHPFTVDLGMADTFEFGIGEREANGALAGLLGAVAEETLTARVTGELVFGVTRLKDSLIEKLSQR